MTVIVCVSEGGGMLFLGRRVSKDARVIENVGQLVGDGALFVSEYTEKLFSDSALSVIVATDPLKTAGKGDFVFAEQGGISAYSEKIERLVIYRWNRRYPFDTALDLDPASAGLVRRESIDIVGRSHEKITREIYER